MDEPTIKALMQLDTTVVEGRKVIVIPYEDLLRGNISIRINQPQGQLRAVEPPVSTTTISAKTANEVINIPPEIQKLYPLHMKAKMAQDVTDYLDVIAKVWEYKNLGFQPSLLKKAAKSKPALNGAVFQTYDKQGDQYLTALVNSNMAYIRQRWAEAAQ